MCQYLLSDGPDALQGVHSVRDDVPPERVVVAYYGQHQHFELTSETAEVDGTVLPVLRWTYSTAIAE